MKYIKSFLPMLVVVITIFNLVASIESGNDSAMYANITALIGWALLAVESYTEFLITK
ncbi:MAG: hypothetical protein ACOVLB_05885 [Candidatus Nanopelagicus sp.]